MSDTDRRSAKELFRQWRSGDAAAGQAMAQRFADWYYAIATVRMGERIGRAPCRVACERFGQGVGQVTEVRSLVDWAHGVITEELTNLGLPGNRVPDGDEPSMYSANQSPKALLLGARSDLPAELELLEACYALQADPTAIDRLAEPMGGNPLGILRARYRVKAWLAANRQVPFQVMPAEPNLDRAPLPLYESGRMASAQEEVNFEHWMITDLDLCKDIAEFAPFTVALRGGLPKVRADSTAAAPSAGAGKKAALMIAVGLVIIVAITLAAIAAVVALS